jgi:hypothetical protein
MRNILRRDEAKTTESLRRAIEGDEFGRPDFSHLVTEIAPAVIVYRIVVAGEACDESFVEHLVDDILMPLLRGT